MVQRNTLAQRVQTNKNAISENTIQIKAARKRSIFRGVRIEDQFAVGHSNIKSFMSRRKGERKVALGDLGIISSKTIGLRDALRISEKDLADFDLGVVL